MKHSICCIQKDGSYLKHVPFYDNLLHFVLLSLGTIVIAKLKLRIDKIPSKYLALLTAPH